VIDNNVEEIKEHLEAIMSILGIERTESNKNTPLRVAKMYCNELFKNRNLTNKEELDSQIKIFNRKDIAEAMPVAVKNIAFSSTCEHHWLPFMGTVDISYIPNDLIIGLSKLPRVVKYFSQMPQLQERLTCQIGEYLVSVLAPKSLSVKITAVHCCVKCRGIENDCTTETFYDYNS